MIWEGAFDAKLNSAIGRNADDAVLETSADNIDGLGLHSGDINCKNKNKKNKKRRAFHAL
jgi:hypothetical protein